MRRVQYRFRKSELRALFVSTMSKCSVISIFHSLSSTSPPAYSFDHIAPPGSNVNLPRVVLYGSPTSPSFQQLFTFLYQLAVPKPPAPKTSSGAVAPHPPRLQFILRWKPSKSAIENQEKLVLTGYGAALDIKKSDYLAIDDRINAPAGTSSGSPASSNIDSNESAPPTMDPVKKADIPGKLPT